MNTPWFKRRGLLYIPISGGGWSVLVIAMLSAIYKFISIDKNSHSVSDTLIGFGMYFVLIVAIYTSVGYMKRMD